MKNIFFLLMVTIGLLSVAKAQTTDIKPQGIYKEIDISKQNNVIEILKGENKELKQQTVDNILQNPSDYNPPVIYALSRELYLQDKKEEATYWFYLAQLKARYDANLCMDNSAKQAVPMLNNEYGPEINKYAFQDIKTLEKTIYKVVNFMRTNEDHYDHRWINLHGMDAILAGMDSTSEKKELSQPKKKWDEIKKKTVDDYYNGFIEYVKTLKK
ncbi:hypothetical protein [Pedobacter sp. ASV28]|uniref:hypothetical protein n=1 Tax=Pedobacter sp. ASV28 TaxID=2795123 RepID=UPI0018EB4E46|nr:hypothetical protein [Pedobacter sp. ASV28]